MKISLEVLQSSQQSENARGVELKAGQALVPVSTREIKFKRTINGKEEDQVMHLFVFNVDGNPVNLTQYQLASNVVIKDGDSAIPFVKYAGEVAAAKGTVDQDGNPEVEIPTLIVSQVEDKVQNGATVYPLTSYKGYQEKRRSMSGEENAAFDWAKWKTDKEITGPSEKTFTVTVGK